MYRPTFISFLVVTDIVALIRGVGYILYVLYKVEEYKGDERERERNLEAIPINDQMYNLQLWPQQLR